MVFRLKIKSETEGMKAVYISTEEIEKRFFKYNRKDQIQDLVDTGELEVTQRGKAFNYKSLKPGGFDLTLIETKSLPDDRIYKIMITHLKNVNMPLDADRTEYFDLFLKYKLKAINLFFKVDGFSKRVHTPVTTQKSTQRPNLLLYGKETTGLDAQTMQPLLLGKILYSQIGENDFSQWLNDGNDIYLMLKERLGINTRGEAKKVFYKIFYSFPNKDLARMFGDANWINWINEYKSKPEPLNKTVKHLENGSISYHNNLAWLLQYAEVKVMRKVWEALANAGIPFLTVHDELIVQKERANEAYNLFAEVMEKEFTYFKINGKLPENVNQSKPDNEILSTTIKNPGKAIPMIPALEWDLNFNFKNIPNKPIRLSPAVLISNPAEFIYSHLQTCQKNKGSRTFLPYYERIKALEEILTVK
jgi:tRNA(Leu) C34 or U34 (ribose-2'-O)-methylase TrmL